MNAVEIEEATAALAAAPFDPAEFPYSFLSAFDISVVTIKKLRKGQKNGSDVPGAVLLRDKIHILSAENGSVPQALDQLKSSPAALKAKVKFALACDGDIFEAENLISGETTAGSFKELADHVGFFLPLAGITTVKEIKDNPIDVRAVGRLNKLYVELLKENPDWATSERRPEMNHFLARIIFCFYAEDTCIFFGTRLFTATITQMTERDGSDTHQVIEQIFRAMNVEPKDRQQSDLPNFADQFPYVNGGLFSGSTSVPRFSKIARTYLIRAGELNWRDINPDIFGSMIQAVAEDEERGLLGMHYTSVPNILKVLSPLFLDDLREQLDQAGNNKASLLKLRQRISKIRVFDPACGSGNFLVIAYKRMREIESEINRRRGEDDRESDIHLTNFRGIEVRDFAAEIARLALIIAEFQCDLLYRGEKLALAEFLPLNNENWIISGNALRLDWSEVCPPTGSQVSIRSTANDLFETPLEQSEIEFMNEGGETCICGNPPYLGAGLQTAEQKAELAEVLRGRSDTPGILDYVSAWFVKAADYGKKTPARAAFVTTNSICQGQSVPALWPVIFKTGAEIEFAHSSFKWTNLAKSNAGVTVAIVGIGYDKNSVRRLYELDQEGTLLVQVGIEISPYLRLERDVTVRSAMAPLTPRYRMEKGNQPTDGGNLLLEPDGLGSLGLAETLRSEILRRFVGSEEFIRGKVKYCLWISEANLEAARKVPEIKVRLAKVRAMRLQSPKLATRNLAAVPYRFGEIRQSGDEVPIVVPSVSSESREFLPVGLLSKGCIISNLAFAMYNAPLWNMALIASRLHLIWIKTVCGKLETRFRYSNTMGWNTFPIPELTEQNKADLTGCAEDILLAREKHFPKTIADLYKPDEMPDDLRRAHDRNDETLERIYIGRRFRNDTERLEKLFELYEKMIASQPPQTKKRPSKKGKSQTETLLDVSDSPAV